MVLARRWILALGLVGGLLVGMACAPAQPAPAKSVPAAGSAATTAGGASAGGAASAAPSMLPAPEASALQPTPHTGVPEEAPLPVIPELRIARGADMVTLSPFNNFAVQDKYVLKHMLASLVRIDEQGQIQPLLAESWELIAPDTWQFHLRHDVRFHNGEPLTADAVKTTLEVMLAPETRASQVASYRIVKEVQVVDDYTVNIVTHEPNPGLPRRIADLHLLAPGYLREKGHEAAAAHPIGAGPYKFVEWIKGDRLVMEANPDYFAGEPAIKRLVFRPITEDSARVAALLAGEVDLIYNVPVELARQIESSRRASVKAVYTTTFYLLGLNSLNEEFPTAKKAVRQAISYAIDREALARSIMGGLAAPLATTFHTNQFARNPDLKPKAYDPERAKRLLAEAGYPNGFRIQMVASQGRWPKDREMGQAIANQLGTVGIQVDLDVLEYTSFTQQVHSKRLPMALWGWSDTEWDPNAMLINLYTCQDSGSVWSMNCVPELNRLVKAQFTEMDPQARREELRQIQDILYEDEVYVPVVQQGQVRGVSPKMADWYNLRPDEGVWLFHPVKR
jgi:peptide/nickel transport system substrate-binding protein